MDKLKITLICIIAILSSCSDEYTNQTADSDATIESTSLRSFEDALKIAQASISMLDDNQEVITRTSHNRTIDLNSSKVIGGTRTRTGEQGDSLFYVFNFSDNQGFAIVSANKSTEGLIAVTEEGNYDDCIEDNEGLALYMDLASSYVRRTPPSIYEIIENVKNTTDTTSIEQVGPLLKVKWGQRFPEGVFCPNTVAGCSNTALAQVMSYYKYPTQLSLTYENADVSSTTLDWDEMIAHSLSYSYRTNDGCSTKAHLDIAHLCRQLGHLSDSNYYPDSVKYNYNLNTYFPSGVKGLRTETYTISTINTAKTLGYTTGALISYSSKCSYSHINNGHLIIIRGGKNNDGHMWVIDGYKRYVITTTEYRTEEPTITTSISYYNHFNWGWRGDSNGYFLDNVFDSSKGADYDTYSTQTSNYDENVKCFEIYK